MKHWKSITGDPAIVAITDDTRADFVAALEKLPGRKAAYLSGYTVLKHARNIQMILYRAGPRRPGIKHCQGIIADVPQFGLIDRPTAECYGDFSPTELAAM